MEQRFPAEIVDHINQFRECERPYKHVCKERKVSCTICMACSCEPPKQCSSCQRWGCYLCCVLCPFPYCEHWTCVNCRSSTTTPCQQRSCTDNPSKCLFATACSSHQGRHPCPTCGKVACRSGQTTCASCFTGIDLCKSCNRKSLRHPYEDKPGDVVMGPKRLCHGGCYQFYCSAHALRVHDWDYCKGCLQNYIKILEERGRAPRITPLQ